VAFVTQAVHPKNDADRGLDTIAGMALAKNCVCVGAVNDIVPPAREVRVTTFSSFGPADDGRIKPDVVANGFNLLSTSDASDTAYRELSGTSMASPTTTGICCLLADFFQKKKGQPPTSAELRALLVHTATDAGERGPDPIYGWGAINALRAGEVIASTRGELLERQEVQQGGVNETAFDPTGDPIRVTIAWIDPPGDVNTGGLDDATPALTNDLDLKLVAPDGTSFFPYSLNRANPMSRATTTGPNTVDNLEVVDAVTSPGLWKVQVNGTVLRAGAKQPYAIIISGLKKHG